LTIEDLLRIVDRGLPSRAVLFNPQSEIVN